MPSGHAAGAVATALAVARCDAGRGHRVPLLAAAIVAATVLGRYHYLVDSLLGVVVAVGAWLSLSFAVSLQAAPEGPLYRLKSTAVGRRAFSIVSTMRVISWRRSVRSARTRS